MRWYERITLYGALMASAVGVSGCSKGCLEVPSTKPAPHVYISGKVLGEHTHYENNLINRDGLDYTFSVVTDIGVKILRCDSKDCAETLDALISPNVTVKV